MKLHILAAMMLIAMPSSAREINHDIGGPLITYAMEAARVEDRIEIRGTCASACTLFIGRENTCLGPNARLGFHGPYSTRGKMGEDQFDRASIFMAGYYPPKIAAWFMKTARFTGPNSVVWLTSAQAIDMGAKPCL